jgi:hypothetical protein
MRVNSAEDFLPQKSTSPNATLSNNNSKYLDLFAFRNFITPILIQIIFIFGVIIIIFLGFGLFIQGNESILGIFVMLFGWIPLRIVCELAMLNFRIHDELVTLNKTMSKQIP